jgi:hypothetical protein
MRKIMLHISVKLAEPKHGENKDFVCGLSENPQTIL